MKWKLIRVNHEIFRRKPGTQEELCCFRLKDVATSTSQKFTSEHEDMTSLPLHLQRRSTTYSMCKLWKKSRYDVRAFPTYHTKALKMVSVDLPLIYICWVLLTEAGKSHKLYVLLFIQEWQQRLPSFQRILFIIAVLARRLSFFF